jgi:hypothetical protein
MDINTEITEILTQADKRRQGRLRSSRRAFLGWLVLGLGLYTAGELAGVAIYSDFHNAGNMGQIHTAGVHREVHHKTHDTGLF